jgi:GNAT superfamily N-acetyltransferase
VFDRDNELVGVLDAIVDWPDPGVWTMGMLLLDPTSRGSGLGTAVLNAYEEWAGMQGASEFRTAVVSHHERGRRFLQRTGYRCASTLDDYNAGAREATVLFYSKTA